MTLLPQLVITRFGSPKTGSQTHPLLVVGPSLGTTARPLWSAVAALLSDRLDIVGFDLPGHGARLSTEPASTMAALAQAVLLAVDALQSERRECGQPFLYAGVSVSGCIGLQLLLDAPERIMGGAILNSAAKIGEPAAWRERAQLVLREGCEAVRSGSAQRWFAPGFIDRQPLLAQTLLNALSETDPAGYAGVCEALAQFDVRERLAAISTSTVFIGGEDDMATPPESLRFLAAGVMHGHAEILSNVGHLAPAEAPEAVAAILSGFFSTLTKVPI